MILNFDDIAEKMAEIKRHLNGPEELVPPAKENTKNVDEEVAEELSNSPYSNQTKDAQFITKCYKYLRKLGYADSQYQFSEQFLNKNKYYFGMILCEHRKPSIDCVHNLIRNISDLNECVNQNNPVNYFDVQTNETPQAKWQCRRANVGIVSKRLYLDRLYKEGQDIITRRLLKYL